jgi:exopolyphosphatase/guanosine-5'-triphosphate,3'-diphosphate pyrophosphatase
LKLAAVDIGSNAARLQVSSALLVAEEPKFKRVEYLRFPLRLGHDVFRHQRIGMENEQRLIQLLKAFKILIELHGVDSYRVCATSALRDANNKHEIACRVQEALGISIHIVGGEEEALLIHAAIRHLLDEHNNYLHVDVGGGSTEVSLYTGSQKIASRSFDLGSMRVLEHHDTTLVWGAMQTWIATQKQYFTKVPIGIATGGNIRKLAQLAKRGMKKPLSLKRLRATRNYIAAHSLAERINSLALNPDRADVILPAIEIYDIAMRCGGVEKILVPDVSLRDGIIQVLYERARGVSASPYTGTPVVSQ